MTTKLLALKEPNRFGIAVEKGEYLDQQTGRVYADAEGLKPLRDMIPTEYVLGANERPVPDENGNLISRASLSNVAAEHYHRQAAKALGLKSMPVRMRAADGDLVAMDLGVGDVHTAAALPNYAAGYHIADGIADVAAPVVMVPKQQDVYYTWNATSDFNRKIPNAAAPGAAPSEVNPSLAPSTYNAVEYALAGFLPTEVQSNADAPLRPFAKLVQIVTDALRLEREYRVATALQTSGNWNSNLVQTILSGAQWNGGGAADPIAVLHKAIEQSYMEDNLHICWSELVFHDFLRNPAVQKYFTYKDGVNGLPDAATVSSTFALPPIHVAQMKYLTAGGQLQYVWGNNAVLVRIPKETPPTSQMEVATMYTMRWNGGTAPDGSYTGGFLVRTYYDPKRGARGGTQVVVVHNDAEQMTSGLVGAYISAAHQ